MHKLEKFRLEEQTEILHLKLLFVLKTILIWL